MRPAFARRGEESRAGQPSVAPDTDAHLILAGPAPTSVADDPEQPQILRELSEKHSRLPEPIRKRVHIAQLPMEDEEENSALVNAMQRRADVVVQKSLAEGFGLWFERFVPLLGRALPGGGAYAYLPASVRRFPPSEELAGLLSRCGFDDVRFRLLGGSIVALHTGTAA